MAPAPSGRSRQGARWYRADYPPDDVAGRLVVIPEVSERLLLTGWAERATEQGAVLIRHESERGQIVAKALAAIGEPSLIDDAELVADFSPGVCLFEYRAVDAADALHQQPRRSTLRKPALAAARAAAEGNFVGARERLTSSFDNLMDGRERFYPVDSYLLDLTLVAPTTLGNSLCVELAAGRPMNVVLTAETLELMERDEPATLTALDPCTRARHGWPHRRRVSRSTVAADVG